MTGANDGILDPIAVHVASQIDRDA